MLLDDIANHLSTAVAGLTLDVNLWKLPIPETVTSTAVQVAVLEYGGRPAMRAMGPSAGAPVAEITRFNIAVVGGLSAYATTRTMAESIYETLDFTSETTLGTTRYLHIRALQPPIYFPPDDESAQHHFSVNFEATKVRG
jgi:hypothetical protein